MKRQTQTRDIGFAIRDLCEDNAISHVDEDGIEKYGADAIYGVDVSDPDNPVLHMESHAEFTVRIVRTK